MKISEQKFQPVTVTFETPEEYLTFLEFLGCPSDVTYLYMKPEKASKIVNGMIEYNAWKQQVDTVIPMVSSEVKK